MLSIGVRTSPFTAIFLSWETCEIVKFCLAINGSRTQQISFTLKTFLGRSREIGQKSERILRQNITYEIYFRWYVHNSQVPRFGKLITHSTVVTAHCTVVLTGPKAYGDTQQSTPKTRTKNQNQKFHNSLFRRQLPIREKSLSTDY